MHRLDFLNSISAVTAAVPLGIPVVALGAAEVAGIRIPDTALARDAREVALSSEPSEIYNHSLRTYLFAQLLARYRRAEHDVEAVYVASILHDTGLATAHMSPNNRFEIDGANVAREVLARHGVTGERADSVWDAICFHDSSIAQWKGDVAKLVSDGVGVDFGDNLDILKRADVVAVLKTAPRDRFIPVFLNAVAEIGRRKPHATGKCFVTDVAIRMVPGFHLTNFCDSVKDDPFSRYGQAES